MVRIISVLIVPILLICRLVQYSVLVNEARVMFLRILGAKVGVNVVIRPGVYFKGIKKIEIGDNVYLGEGTAIVGSGAAIKIGSDVMIAENVYISSRNHRFRDQTSIMKEQGYKDSPVSIEDDVWLAHSVVVLAGSVIQSGSVIAAGVVSPKVVEKGSLVRPQSPLVEVRVSSVN